MKGFKVNDYITLKLEGGKTNIYVKDQLFNQCKFLLLNIPVDKISTFDEIESIDEAVEKIDRSFGGRQEDVVIIPPEVEFWGHCSNLQVWAEMKYDTRLLHSNIAFPLLRKLTEVGDPIANKIFKEEIIKRFESGNLNLMIFLIEAEYLDVFNMEEKAILSGKVFFIIQGIVSSEKYQNFKNPNDVDDYFYTINKLFGFLNREDAIKCINRDGINLIEKTINKLLDYCSDDFGFEDSIEWFLDPIGEYIESEVNEIVMSMISTNNGKKIKTLALLNLLDYLSEEYIIKCHNYSEFLAVVYRHYWEDDIFGINILNFRRNHFRFLANFWKKRIPEIIKNDNVENLFIIWDFKMLYEEQFLEFLKDPALNMFENYLKVLHYMYLKEYYYTKRFYDWFVFPRQESKNISKYFRIDILRLVKMRNLSIFVPLFACNFLSYLNREEIIKLIKDPKVNLLLMVLRALDEYWDEFRFHNRAIYNYINEDFIESRDEKEYNNWMSENLQFFMILDELPFLDIKKNLFEILKTPDLNYWSLILHGLIRKFKYRELLDVLEDKKSLELFFESISKISGRKAYLIRDVYRFYDKDVLKYYEGLGAHLSKPYRNSIINLLKESQDDELPSCLDSLGWYQYFPLKELREMSQLFKEKEHVFKDQYRTLQIRRDINRLIRKRSKIYNITEEKLVRGGNIDQLIREASIFGIDKEYGKALELYEKLLSLPRTPSYFWEKYLNILLELKDADKVADFLDEMLVNGKTFYLSKPKVYYFKGLLNCLTNNIQDCVKNLDLCIQLDYRYFEIIGKDTRFKKMFSLKEFQHLIRPEDEFKINDYLILKLYRSKIMIFINHEIYTYLSLSDVVSFDTFCKKMKTWVENDYDTSNITEDDIEFYFSLLRKLYETGVLKARQVFKKEITNRIKYDETYHLKQFLIYDDYISYLSTQELIEGILEPDEAKVLMEIQTYTSNSYHLVIEFEPDDEIRRRTRADRYYFSIHRGHIIEVDLELNRFNSAFPESIFSLKELTDLHLFVYDVDEVNINTDKVLESLEVIYLYSLQEVKSPSLHDYFPNLTNIRRIRGRKTLY